MWPRINRKLVVSQRGRLYSDFNGLRKHNGIVSNDYYPDRMETKPTEHASQLAKTAAFQ